jgi:hypothetical protein
LRIVCLVATVGWIALWVAAYSFMPPEARSSHLRLGILAVFLVAAWNMVSGDLETQIRHFNDLALAPWESRRMTVGRVTLMWVGDAMMFLSFLLIGAALSIWPVTDVPGYFAGLFVIVLASGFLLGQFATSFAGLFASRYVRYDPEEDEWQGLWWSWRDR